VADARRVQVEDVEVVRACPPELEVVAGAVIEGLLAGQDRRAADSSDEEVGRGAAVVPAVHSSRSILVVSVVSSRSSRSAAASAVSPSSTPPPGRTA